MSDKPKNASEKSEAKSKQEQTTLEIKYSVDPKGSGVEVEVVCDKLFDLDKELPKINSEANYSNSSMYGNKLICIPEALLKANKSPRRANTHGGRAWALIVKEGGKMSYKNYRKSGGNNNHIGWNLERGWMYLIPDPSPANKKAKDKEVKTEANKPNIPQLKPAFSS